MSRRHDRQRRGLDIPSSTLEKERKRLDVKREGLFFCIPRKIHSDSCTKNAEQKEGKRGEIVKIQRRKKYAKERGTKSTVAAAAKQVSAGGIEFCDPRKRERKVPRFEWKEKGKKTQMRQSDSARELQQKGRRPRRVGRKKRKRKGKRERYETDEMDRGKNKKTALTMWKFPATKKKKRDDFPHCQRAIRGGERASKAFHRVGVLKGGTRHGFAEQHVMPPPDPKREQGRERVRRGRKEKEGLLKARKYWRKRGGFEETQFLPPQGKKHSARMRGRGGEKVWGGTFTKSGRGQKERIGTSLGETHCCERIQEIRELTKKEESGIQKQRSPREWVIVRGEAKRLPVIFEEIPPRS